LEIGIEIHVNPEATLMQVILSDLDILLPLVQSNLMRQEESPNADFFLPTALGTMSSVRVNGH